MSLENSLYQTFDKYDGTLYPLKFKLRVFRFGRKKTVIVPMVLAALASMGAVLLTRNTAETGG